MPNRHATNFNTDYIRDGTPEWYAEVDRIATIVEERAMSARKKRYQTESHNAHVDPQRQLTQQTLTGSTHKKKKSALCKMKEQTQQQRHGNIVLRMTMDK